MKTIGTTILQGTTEASIVGTVIIDAANIINFSMQATVTGGVTTAGSFRFLVSNDIPPKGQRAGFIPTNWLPISGGNASVTITAGVAASTPIHVLQSYQWIKAEFIRTAGVVGETLTVVFFSSGA